MPGSWLAGKPVIPR